MGHHLVGVADGGHDLELVAGQQAQRRTPGAELGPGRAEHHGGHVGHGHRPGQLSRHAQQAGQPRHRRPFGLVDPAPVEGQRHLPGEHFGHGQLRLREVVRLVVVEHELADDVLLVDERHERQRADALGPEDRPELGHLRVGVDVADEDRLGRGVVGRPRRVPFHRLAVRLRQAPPGLEPHDAVGVVEQQRRPVRAHRGDDRLHRRPIEADGGRTRFV